MVGNYEKRRIPAQTFLVIPNIQITSDDVVIRSARRLLLEQILQCDAVKIAADDPLQPLPHGQGGALSAARASIRVLFETGDGREPALGQTQKWEM